jgi:UDP-N-acetylglucosamine:LPS N-acetylglucosamine transferase
MPQEAGTVDLIEKKGAGILLKNSIDIVPAIQNLLDDSVKYAAMKAATVNLAIPNSTQRIIEEITALLPAQKKIPTPQPATV